MQMLRMHTEPLLCTNLADQATTLSPLNLKLSFKFLSYEDDLFLQRWALEVSEVLKDCFQTLTVEGSVQPMGITAAALQTTEITVPLS